MQQRVPFIIFESSFLRIRIFYDYGDRYELDLNLCPFEKIDKLGRPFGIDMLARLHDPDIWRGYLSPSPYTPEEVEVEVQVLAARLRKYGESVLRGDLGDLVKLAELEEEAERKEAERGRLIREFHTECRAALGFLVTEYGFSGPEIEGDRQIIKVFFSKREIAVECVLDVRDEMISVYIVRLDNGKKPSGYIVNEKGEVVREYLRPLLIRRGIRDFKSREPIDLEGLSERQASFRKILLGQARLLRMYGQDILDGSASIFEMNNNSGKLAVILDEFVTECRAALGFLVTEYGFSGPEIEVERMILRVFFSKQEVAVECVLNVDEMISVYIVRLDNGKRPNVHRVNDKGEVVREGLMPLLVRRGIRDLKSRESIDLKGLSERQASFRKILLRQARLLRMYGQDILAGSAKIFET